MSESEQPDQTGPIQKTTTPLHPASGAAILGLDWLLFGSNAATGWVATPIIIVGGFVLGGASTFLVQKFASKDSTSKSLMKALAAGVAVGVPAPIAGTALGGSILGWSGLALFKNRLLPKPVEKP